VHSFPVTLFTADTQSITDTAGATGSQNGIVVLAAAADHFDITDVPDSVEAGTSFDVTVTARDPYGNVAPDYQGTVHFDTSDPVGGLPDDYTFTAADHGTHTFPQGGGLVTAGDQTVTATDVDTGISGSAVTTVTPAAADHFQVDAPDTAVSGQAFDLTVTALDPYGNVDTNTAGTVTFSSSDTDPNVVVPPDSQLTDGVGYFPSGATLITVGDQTITASDVDTGISGNATVTVTDAPGPRVAGGGAAFPAPADTATAGAVSPAPATGGLSPSQRVVEVQVSTADGLPAKAPPTEQPLLVHTLRPDPLDVVFAAAVRGSF
jgi:hypothetical protein